jgi:hypothetical protein
MRRHIISYIKGTALRRTLLKTGGIGKSRSTEKFRAFAGFRLRAPSRNKSLARQLKVLPDQDFATECFLEAWSAEETSGFVGIRNVIK